MVVKDKVKNREYVAKSRQKLINRIGIDEYRKKMAYNQREYRKKLKALKMLIFKIEKVEIWILMNWKKYEDNCDPEKVKVKKMI